MGAVGGSSRAFQVLPLRLQAEHALVTRWSGACMAPIDLYLKRRCILTEFCREGVEGTFNIDRGEGRCLTTHLPSGGMAEWFKASVLKTDVGNPYREFESHSHRH